jgi:hypothetical protein
MSVCSCAWLNPCTCCFVHTVRSRSRVACSRQEIGVCGLTNVMTETPNECPQLRAAFDFGSGASKLAIAFVPDATQPTRELDVLFEEEFELLIGISVSRSPNGAINDDILQQLQALVAKLRGIVDRTLAEVAASRGLNHLSLRMTAVCTAVYREASNGAQARDVIQDGLGVHTVRILTAAEEGHIGFLTGLIAARPQLGPSNDVSEVAVYDSGGASFQITLGSGSDPSAARVIGCAEGNWGSGKAVHAMLTRVQQKAAAKDHYVTCNPVSIEEAAKLRSLIDGCLTSRRCARRSPVAGARCVVRDVDRHRWPDERISHVLPRPRQQRKKHPPRSIGRCYQRALRALR